MTVPPRFSTDSIDILLNSTHSEVRRLSVKLIDDMIVISGRVSCYYHKQIAQEAILKAKGDIKLVNLVQVVSES